MGHVVILSSAHLFIIQLNTEHSEEVKQLSIVNARCNEGVWVEEQGN